VSTRAEVRIASNLLTTGLVTEQFLVNQTCAAAPGVELERQLKDAADFVGSAPTCRSFVASIRGSLTGAIRGAAYSGSCLSVELTFGRPSGMSPGEWMVRNYGRAPLRYLDRRWSGSGGYACRSFEADGRQHV